ncbi:MerR family transcriptional regulator [Desertihabitans aurantiacus]|uniref:MerR family transcriptional regulator n=1 Tax=Desertihabitans aurantiacus TaxID=2282477 RepID=UPI000DF7E350|nr:MerR family transcriptional regulator [Desertihabitans aurantiacus]
MSWSTRELALLAGTTVNTVRHYHRRGLLDQPHRGTNGYKHYGVEHLVRLLQIRRLREVGVPIAELELHEHGVGTSARVLLDIDAELVETVERSRRARAEIEAMLRHGSTGGVPSGFERVAERMSPRERSLALVYAQLYDEVAMADVREMLDGEVDEVTAEFEELPADADEVTRDRLARQLAGPIARAVTDHPWLSAPQERLRQDERTAARTWMTAVAALYNEAQVDVLRRAGERAALQRGRQTGRVPTGPGAGRPTARVAPEGRPSAVPAA